MKSKKTPVLKNEKGFTLIEIIAVIIIMGILAAVAVPKFFSMQEDAKTAVLKVALSEAAARFNHAYGKYILVVKKAPSDVSTDLATADYLGLNAATTGENIGDFDVTWIKTGADELTITVVKADTIGAAALAAMPAADKEKLITSVTWGP